MGKVIEERTPLTLDEITEYLDNDITQKVHQWGKDSFYADKARESKEIKLAQWKAGKVISVYSRSYCDRYGNGTGDFSDTLMSDGTVETSCYGYTD